MGRQRSALQVGQHAGDLFAPAGGHGSGQSALRAEEDRAGHQELASVHVERRLWCAESGRRKDRRSIGPSSTMTTLLRLSLPCEMPAACKRATCCHRSSSVWSLTCSGLASSSGSMSGWRVTTSASPLGAEGGGHDFRHADSRLRRHQGGQRLVLDLLQPAGWSASRRILVGEKAPPSCEPLGVLRIATEHAHLQSVPLCVMADVLRRRRRCLLRRRPQVAHLDSERGDCARGSARSAARPPPSRTPAVRLRPQPGRGPVHQTLRMGAKRRARRHRAMRAARATWRANGPSGRAPGRQRRITQSLRQA